MSLFSQRFKQLKEESNLTLKGLAETFEVSVTTMSYYLNGREPSFDLLINIAEHFGVTTDWLLGVSDARDPDQELIFKDVTSKLKDKKTTEQNRIRNILLKEQLENAEDQRYFSEDQPYDEEKEKFVNISEDSSVLKGDAKKMYIDIQKQLYDSMDEIYYFLAGFTSTSLDKHKDEIYAAIKLVVKNFYQFFYYAETFFASEYDFPLTFDGAVNYLKRGELNAELEKQLLRHLTYLFAYDLLVDIDPNFEIISKDDTWNESEKKLYEELLNFNYSNLNTEYSLSHLEDISNQLNDDLLSRLKKMYGSSMTDAEIIDMASLY